MLYASHLLFDQIRRHWRVIRPCFFCQLEQPEQLLGLLFVKLDKLNAKARRVVMSNFTLKIKPVIIGQQHAKADDLASSYLANRIEVAAALRQICDPRTVTRGRTLPGCVKPD